MEPRYVFSKPIESIAVIGAGASGIVLAKAAIAQGFKSIRVFEKRGDFGGNWTYNATTFKSAPFPNLDPFATELPFPGDVPEFISSSYTDLFANVPREIMNYADKSFPNDVPLYPHRSQVLEYLREYGSDIRHLVSFHHEVVSVEKEEDRWVLRVKDYSSRKTFQQSFDAVAVASGHYDLPLIPPIRDFHLYPSEKVTHAKYYRRPSDCLGKGILLIGNNASGIDIANQLVPYAAQVIRSIRSEMHKYFWSHPKITDVPTIDRFTSNSIILTDGSELDVDAVIFCTGYLYTFPFFSREHGFVKEHENYIHNLYDQTFYVDDPTLVFLGMPRQIMPFPTFQNQSILVTKVWAQKFSLPDTETMRLYETDRLKKLNYDHDKYHCFPHPEDIELGERWREWIETDKSDGWEQCMNPWKWTIERVQYKESGRELRGIFQMELDNGKLDYLLSHRNGVHT